MGNMHRNVTDTHTRVRVRAGLAKRALVLFLRHDHWMCVRDKGVFLTTWELMKPWSNRPEENQTNSDIAEIRKKNTNVYTKQNTIVYVSQSSS